MKYKKSLIIIMLAIFLLSIAGVCASDVDDTAIASEDNTEIELSQSDETDEISVTDDSPVIEQSNNEEKLTAGNIWYVNSSAANGAGTSENPFNNLKDTLDASGDNDIIKIASGTYAGENNTYLIINKNLTFERYGEGDAIFDGGNTYGIWEIQAKSINITGLTFQNGYGGNGGALSFKSELINSNINANFNNNQAMSSGGAIHFSEALSNVNITGNFTKNNAHGYSYDGEGGGAICFLGELNRVNIIGDFTGNIAQSFAGANYFKSNIANVNIYGNYKNNSAIEQNGGANWFMALENVAITGNFTNNIALGFGGANVFSEELKNVNITGNFINNNATWNNGGANQFKEKLTNVAITGDYSYNKANQNGGANWFGDSKALDNVNITGNYYHNEAGQNGGANRIGLATNVNIIGNYTENIAKGSGSWDGGGAIFVSNNPTKLAIAANFYSNTATSAGAAICFYNSMSNANLIGNFINNTGKSVIYCWGTSNSEIHDSIFVNNSKINVDGSGTLKIADTWFGNNATNYDVAPDENKIDFDNWLFLNATVDSNDSDASKISNIIFKLYSYNDSGVLEYNKNLLNPNLTITATNGNVSKNIAKLGESIQFTPTKGGTATVTATVENARQTVEIAVKGDFDLLQDLVNNESLSVINLERNYAYNEFDTITGGVRVTRPITINGNGYTIDAKGKSRIFYIEAENVVIENITFKNANINDGNGGAIFFSKSGSVTNCNFTNNSAWCGGAVDFANNGEVTNCNFANNKATDNTYGGGAIYIFSGTVVNCNFTNNNATTGDGGAIWTYRGTVEKCNFVNNSATNHGGAIWFSDKTELTNCNFTNNSAGTWGGAIMFANKGTLSNCNLVNNFAINLGGAVFFLDTGNITDCNFTNNTANRGGAIFFYSSGIVDNCNLTGNDAPWGSAIYFYNYKYGSSISRTISNSCLLNNKANVDADNPLNVTINENNITIIFKGQNNLINAIYSRNDAEVNFTNVIYWGANGITKTGSSPIILSNKEAGQNITIAVVVNDKIVFNDVKVTDENGTIVLDITVGENYYIGTRHNEDSYYTEAEKIISQNIKFYANLTSISTNNRTVNITAKSNIPNDIIEGKLLFILPNGDEINANYASNGTWWAVYEFADYADYQVNASYIGLDNVTVTNATISIVKANSTVNVSDVVLNYGESTNVTVTAEGATGITAMIDNKPVTVINNYTIVISDLAAGNYTLTVTTKADADHESVNKTVNVTVNKVDSTLTVNNITFDYKATGSANVSFTGAAGVNASVVNQPKATVNVNNSTITVSGLDAGTYTLTVTTITDANHNPVTKNATVTVNKSKTQLIANAITATYKVNKDLVISLKDSNGNPLTGVKVTVNLNGAKTLTTDKNGQVKVSTKALVPKTYTATITYEGDNNHVKSTSYVKVVVNKAKPKIIAKKKTYKAKAKVKKFTITLKDNLGKPIKKAKVTISVKKITKKKAKKKSKKSKKKKKKANTAKTNKKGKATFKIDRKKKGKYLVTIKFKGNKYYTKVTKKVKITIK